MSKAAMLELVRDHRARDVARALAEKPSLTAARDRRGRNWLHLCCAVKIAERRLDPAAGKRTADALLAGGIDIDSAAFTEPNFRATPLWYAIAHGRNLALAKHLLAKGCDPNYCAWAAAFNDDAAALRLLAAYGAPLDLTAEGASPFLFAVQWSRFTGAEQLLKLGVNVNYQDAKGRTALHVMLKKGSDRRHFEMLARFKPRVDLPDGNGVRAEEIMRRKRDPFLRALALRLTAEA